ncbi:glutamine synthetase type III [bacterium]|nr:glutamine synthetase type III [bacterium]
MGKIVSNYGELVFTKKEMQQRLNPKMYTDFIETLENGSSLNESIAEDIARAIKEWALENGATHFTHWFQPQRNGTAEKHDAFIDYDKSGNIIETFNAKQLIQSEPDASSFPSGGIRSTFEARGYTAWDPTSPVFLRETKSSKSLIIPSIYLSWTGEALDMKTPLNRSTYSLNKYAIELQKLLGNRLAKRIKVFSGLEQEYFLIPIDKASKRLDLQICGRTVFGSSASKGQIMEDHYFGSIQTKVMEFMNHLDLELYRYGIPIKTKHNEVAPNQFELAPLYEEINLAIDHNLLTMEIMRRISQEHNFLVLFHEKPFSDVNGSGKHMNWSLGDNTGANYLEPSRSPLKNISFLMTLAAVLLGVKEHSGLLRAAISDAGNEYRLGANEAPPAILSVYLGSYLTDLLDHIEGVKRFTDKEIQHINHGLESMPLVVKDYSDRNRTSPIAFTGNKFELRALGASANGATAARILNMLCAYGYKNIINRFNPKKDVKKQAFQIIKDVLKETKEVRFEGNNYSKEWHKEAKKRKLFQVETTPEAIKYELNKKSIALYEDLNILSKREIESRVEIRLEAFSNTKIIELKVAIEMTKKEILPAIAKQISQLGSAYINAASAKIMSKALTKELNLLEILYSSIHTKEEYIQKYIGKLEQETDAFKLAQSLAEKGEELLLSLRKDVDQAEKRVSYEYWSLPSYDQLLLNF